MDWHLIVVVLMYSMTIASTVLVTMATTIGFRAEGKLQWKKWFNHERKFLLTLWGTSITILVLAPYCLL